MRPVDFLKIRHRGSNDGTPSQAVLDLLFLSEKTDGRPRSALLLTEHGTYQGVPDNTTLGLIAARVNTACDTRTVDLGSAVETPFEG